MGKCSQAANVEAEKKPNKVTGHCSLPCFLSGSATGMCIEFSFHMSIVPTFLMIILRGLNSYNQHLCWHQVFTPCKKEKGRPWIFSQTLSGCFRVHVSATSLGLPDVATSRLPLLAVWPSPWRRALRGMGEPLGTTKKSQTTVVPTLFESPKVLPRSRGNDWYGVRMKCWILSHRRRFVVDFFVERSRMKSEVYDASLLNTRQPAYAKTYFSNPEKLKEQSY